MSGPEYFDSVGNQAGIRTVLIVDVLKKTVVSRIPLWHLARIKLLDIQSVGE